MSWQTEKNRISEQQSNPQVENKEWSENHYQKVDHQQTIGDEEPGNSLPPLVHWTTHFCIFVPSSSVTLLAPKKKSEREEFVLNVPGEQAFAPNSNIPFVGRTSTESSRPLLIRGEVSRVEQLALLGNTGFNSETNKRTHALLSLQTIPIVWLQSSCELLSLNLIQRQNFLSFRPKSKVVCEQKKK
ncbi:hypothetical protein Ocin01_03775 [Orchesella cincta]|uniref:Uncharacterized protein n=1 Tax=Orchesella cincta TaxID=48709 RepID=A0A1D2NCE2_ORCCI|nr:hypothetical protein Ocin01_03775 [Orchesella cincta]